MFLLAAFLFTPAFLRLIARLVFVTRVLETISILLNIKIKYLFLKCNRLEFLTIIKPFVKAFKIMFLLPKLACALHISQLDQSLTLSKGQVLEITSSGIEQFAIGNKDVIALKFDNKTKKLYLSALMQGHSQLNIFGASPKKIDIYVLSKNQQLKLIEDKNNLEAIGIKDTYTFGQKLIINGEIQNIDQYLNIVEILKNNPNQIINNLKLKKELAKQIIANIYFDFFENYLDDIFCEEIKAQIKCSTTLKILKNKEFIDVMRQKHGAQFMASLTFGKMENYQVEMKIFQIEKLDGSEINFGLDQLQANLNDVFTSGPKSLIRNNNILLKDSNLDFSTLATPKAILKIDEPLIMKIGSDIPYQSSTATATNTEWKFAGLSIDLKMIKENNKYSINYKTNLSRPTQVGDGLSITGNSQQSSFSIDLDKPIQIFEIDLKTDSLEESSIPLIKSIPILKNIFSSKSKINTFKKIVAIVRITKKEL